jgi:hypothetical protein
MVIFRLGLGKNHHSHFPVTPILLTFVSSIASLPPGKTSFYCLVTTSYQNRVELISEVFDTLTVIDRGESIEFDIFCRDLNHLEYKIKVQTNKPDFFEDLRVDTNGAIPLRNST